MRLFFNIDDYDTVFNIVLMCGGEPDCFDTDGCANLGDKNDEDDILFAAAVCDELDAAGVKHALFD